MVRNKAQASYFHQWQLPTTFTQSNHMIFPLKHAMETHSEVIPLWSREDENYVGLQKHTSKFIVLNLWISQCHPTILRDYHNHHNISHGQSKTSTKRLSIFNQHTKEEMTHENILLIHVQQTAVTLVSGIILDMDK